MDTDAGSVVLDIDEFDNNPLCQDTVKTAPVSSINRETLLEKVGLKTSIDQGQVFEEIELDDVCFSIDVTTDTSCNINDAKVEEQTAQEGGISQCNYDEILVLPDTEKMKMKTRTRRQTESDTEYAYCKEKCFGIMCLGVLIVFLFVILWNSLKSGENKTNKGNTGNN